jgi:hypothetical protein
MAVTMPTILTNHNYVPFIIFCFVIVGRYFTYLCKYAFLIIEIKNVCPKEKLSIRTITKQKIIKGK